MDIEIYRKKRLSLVDFANEHNLVLEAHERDTDDEFFRWYVYFKGCEVKDGNVLCGVFGDGRTIKEAIANYTEAISGKLIVIDAYKETRKEIYVPILKCEQEEKEGNNGN